MKTTKALFVAAAMASMSASAEAVKVSSFGFDPDDSTRFLQAALDSPAPEIVVDKMQSAWVTGPLKGSSNKRVLFEDGVEVVAKKGEFLVQLSPMLSFAGCSNVTLSGRAVLRMRRSDYLKPPYVKSEHRHALNFYGCRNVTIEGLTIVESGGDGIYIGHGNGPSRNFVLRDLVCADNHRQALSVISVDGLLVERCVFKDTRGTPPSDGIDFEPNRNDQSIANVVVRDCQLTGNAGHGIDFHLAHLDATSPWVSVLIENCVMRGNTSAFCLGCISSEAGEVRGSVTLRNCDLDAGGGGSAFTIIKKMEESIDLSFENCRWREKGGAALLPLREEEWKRRVAHPVFIGGTSQIVPVKTDLSAARPVDEKPGEFVRFAPVSTRFAANYVVYADSARTVRLALRVDRVLAKFDYPTGDVVVSRLNGGEVTRFPMPGTKAVEVAFDVPAPGFYTVKAGLGAGGVLELSGTDVPIALNGRASLFKPQCRLYFEVQDADPAAAARVTGGGPNEKVAAKLFTPSGKVFWAKPEGAGAMHRIMLPRGRETGLWAVVLGRATEGSFEDAGFSVVGIPESRFPCREKRWTWMK